MTVLVDLEGTVGILEGPNSGLLGSVHTEEDDGAIELSGDVTVDIEYSSALKPVGVTKQLVSLALEIEGYGIIPPSKLTEGISWERDISAGAKIIFSVDGQNSPIGTEIQWKGPPPGVRNITLWGAYVTSNGPRWTKIISGGIADTSTRSLGKKRIMTINVLDPIFRHNEKKVDYILPPGHKKTPKQIVKEILALMNISNVSIDSSGVQRVKPLEIVCENGIDACKQQADSIGRILYFDREANVKLIAKGYDADVIESQIFTEFNIIDTDSNTIDSTGGEVATRVIVTGEFANAEECGITESETKYELFEHEYETHALFGQNVGGGIFSTGFTYPTGDTPEIIQKRVIKTQTKDCGTLLVERIRTYEWKNLRTWRYRINDAGTVTSYNSGYFMVEAPDTTSELYVWHTERFILVSDVKTFYDYSNEHGGMVFDDTWFNRPQGALFRTRVQSSEYKLLNSALKQNIGMTSTPWEELPYILNKRITGGFDGVSNISQYQNETWFPFLSYEELLYDITDNGFITHDSKRKFSNRIVPGDNYLYNGGGVSKFIDEYQIFTIVSDIVVDPNALISKEDNFYSADEQSGRTTVKQSTDYSVKIPKSKTEIEYSSGYLPKAEFKQAEDTSINVQSFDLNVGAPVLLISHPEFEEPISNSLIETEDEALQFAISELREGSALNVRIEVPFNLSLEPGKVVRLYLRRTGVNEKVFIRNVKGSWSGIGNPIITIAEGRIYVI